MGLRERKTEKSHGLTGHSFTSLEVRCQREDNSYVHEGESREGLSTNVAALQVAPSSMRRHTLWSGVKRCLSAGRTTYPEVNTLERDS